MQPFSSINSHSFPAALAVAQLTCCHPEMFKDVFLIITLAKPLPQVGPSQAPSTLGPLATFWPDPRLTFVPGPSLIPPSGLMLLAPPGKCAKLPF